jgi:hypothetical protein
MKIKYNDDAGAYYENQYLRGELSNVACVCGNEELFVNFIRASHCGCYVKVACPKCRHSEVIFDDYS